QTPANLGELTRDLSYAAVWIQSATERQPMTDTAAVPNVNAGAFAVSPELAAAAFTQISQLQDVVGEMVREAKVRGRTVPLGGGRGERAAVELGTRAADDVGEVRARRGRAVRSAVHRGPFERRADRAGQGQDHRHGAGLRLDGERCVRADHHARGEHRAGRFG